MTMAKIDWRRDGTVPPKANDEVVLVMAELVVGRRTAYDIVRNRKAAEIDTNGISQNQRTAVMAVLISKPEAGKNTDTLIEAMHEAGIRIDGHDVQKTLWALTKNGHVTFRDRRIGDRKTQVYAIKPTREGLSAYNFDFQAMSYKEALETTLAETTTPEEWIEPGVIEPEPEVPEVVVHVLENAKALQEELDEMGAGRQPLIVKKEVVSFERPWIKGNMGGWPEFRDVRDRFLKATKINAAAKLLEEAGEDEIALTLLGKTEFTPLEEEVVDLLRRMGEIE